MHSPIAQIQTKCSIVQEILNKEIMEENRNLDQADVEGPLRELLLVLAVEEIERVVVMTGIGRPVKQWRMLGAEVFIHYWGFVRLAWLLSCLSNRKSERYNTT